jgi:vacuolar-type H+-ATPase subunit I/STV1
MTRGGSRTNTRGVTELDPLLTEIAKLLERSDGADDPARLARTLTDGYARALALEGELARLQTRIGEVTATLSRGDTSPTAELSSLLERIETHDAALQDLRDELARLRDRHSVAIRGVAG